VRSCRGLQDPVDPRGLPPTAAHGGDEAGQPGVLCRGVDTGMAIGRRAAAASAWVPWRAAPPGQRCAERG